MRDTNAALYSAPVVWKIANNYQGKIEMNLSNQQLARYGWNEFFAEHFHEYAGRGYTAGRVALEYNRFYRIYTAQGEILAEIAGRLKHEAESRASLPAVGDWVALRLVEGGNKAVIHA